MKMVLTGQWPIQNRIPNIYRGSEQVIDSSTAVLKIRNSEVAPNGTTFFDWLNLNLKLKKIKSNNKILFKIYWIYIFRFNDLDLIEFDIIGLQMQLATG